MSFERLLGPLPYLMDLDNRYRGGAAVLQFVRCVRCDSPLLIGSDLIRECTGVKMKTDNVHLLADSVRAVAIDSTIRPSSSEIVHGKRNPKNKGQMPGDVMARMS
jgi:hypothetical protein